LTFRRRSKISARSPGRGARKLLAKIVPLTCFDDTRAENSIDD
jgi:hypothetical protein